MIVNIDWNDEAEAGLKVSAGNDIEIIKQQVLKKQSQLWECHSKENHAYVVTRLEQSGNGKELVLVLGEGSGFFEFAPRFIEEAKKQHMKIRTHVTRPGLIKMWSRLGVHVNEYILRN